MNINDLRIILGEDGIYRYKFIVSVQQNYIIINFSIPKTNTTHQQKFLNINDVCTKLNVKQCILNKAIEKTKLLNKPVWLYSLDQID